MLGLLLLGELLTFAVFVVWENWLPNLVLFGYLPPDLTKQNWLFLIGIVAAVTGWIVSAYITMRNSIKQHTINTLLQSRLSATYMGFAARINQSFFPPGAINDQPVTLEHLLDISDKERIEDRVAVNYVLNYFEFLAVGIRHGDLDKNVLKHTMRGILVRLYEKMSLYIKDQRGDDGETIKMPAQLEHLTWLYLEWKDAKPKPK